MGFLGGIFFEICAPDLFRTVGAYPGPSEAIRKIFHSTSDFPESVRLLSHEFLFNSLRETLTTRFESNIAQTMVARPGGFISTMRRILAEVAGPVYRNQLDSTFWRGIVQGGCRQCDVSAFKIAGRFGRNNSNGTNG